MICKRLILLALALVVVIATGSSPADLDGTLRAALAGRGITELEPAPTISLAKVELGRSLFFDPILSGNRDVSCATCHHPTLHTSDGLPLSIGVGGSGLGRDRQLGEGRSFIPRNAPALFHLGDQSLSSMFWDGRVSRNAAGTFITPAGEVLPAGIDSILAAQAMFPVTSRDEMRGFPGDTDLTGRANEIAVFSDYDFEGIWNALWERLMNVDAYRERFEVAFPELTIEKMGFEYAANAIAAFEATAFTLTDSPWDRYLNGRDEALTEGAKRGALLFYGKAGCANCHMGSLMTDQTHHNVGVPPLGPGKLGGLIDSGRGLLTMNEGDRFAFRTPPLRNVAVTGPWMHNGAYQRLEDAVAHMLDPETALHRYDPQQLPAGLQPTVRLEEAMIDTVLATLDPLLWTPVELSEPEFDDLMSFLAALTSPSTVDLVRAIPDEVPSRLTVER
ncbi:MAG: hypothetical protein JSV66_15495 [Trueperaceae bacterium]|nr:MAG: hypothetical protein JSV66_15495 [Trueperaceae bacterium]